MLALSSPRIRASKWGLGGASLLVVLGVALNRVNVFLVAYRPPFAERDYFPSFGEFAVTLALICGLILIYRVVVTYLPVVSHSSSRQRD
jgi:Ni/Fe-hydrogenase subunit HybB-like protein